MITRNMHKKFSLVVVLLTGLILRPGTGLGVADEQQKQKQLPEAPVLDQQKLVTRVFKLRYANPQLLEGQFNNLYKGAATFSSQLVPGSLTVRAVPEIMTSIAEMIKEVDSPPPVKKSIEFTLYLLIAAEEPRAEGKLPEPLQPVVRQLKNTFAYKDYRLLDTLVLQSVDRGALETSGHFSLKPLDALTQPQQKAAFYTISLEPSLSSEEKNRIVEIHRLVFTIAVPGSGESKIRTDIHLREGQTAVIGKTSIHGSSNALILVMTAKVLD